MLLFVYLLFFLRELSAVADQTINGIRECADIYPRNWHGRYIGNRNTTMTGKPCTNWSDTHFPSFGPGNYCRSPMMDTEIGPWCYIGEQPWWEFCFVPECNIDCRPSSIDKGYSGTLNITHSGFTCHIWSNTSILPSGGKVPGYNNELMNFCRTPTTDSETTPWCYTTDSRRRWEYCDVPLCGTITTTICPDLKGEPHMIQPKRLTGYRYGEVVTFICEAGYALNMNTNLKCLEQSHVSIHGKWNSSQPKCIKAVTCSPLNIPQFDVVTNRPIHHLNEIVTLRCKSGYEGHDTIATCTATSMWSYQTPTCNPVTCSPLSSFQFDVVTNRQKHHLNEIVTLKCKSGYDGHDTIATCTANRTWSYQMPTCNPVNCTYLHLNPHVKSSNNMPKFNDDVSLSCEEGYLGNPVIIKCDMYGNWPLDRPNCTARTCTTLKVDPQVMKSKNETKYNDNVTLSCKEGYKGVPTILKCHANGLWPLQRPNCTATICPDLKGEPHMIQPKRLTGYRYGEVVTFICEAGYALNMNTNLKCLEQSHVSIHGKWNSSQPKCIKEYYNESVTCSPLNIPQFDVVTNRQKHHLNEIVTLKCKSGYYGHDTIATCTANRTWSYQMPTCNPVNCTYLHLNPHVKSSNNMPKFNDDVSLSCEEGYLGNPVIIKCDIHGYWPSDRPNCAARTCTTLKVDPQVMKSENETKYHDNVTLSCKEGYKGAPTILKCHANGLWPLQRPNCTVVPCPALNDTEYMNSSINISGYHFGNTISFQCIEGYTLSGPPSITCRSSRNKSMGHWSDQQPSCLALPCPSLKLPMHSLNKDIKESQMYYVDQYVDFKCEKGYNLIGNGTYKCTVKSNSSIVDWNYEDDQTCLEKSKSCKDFMDKRCSCMSYGLCGGTLAVFVAISAGVHIVTCFYFRKREGKSATVYEDMQFKTVERQNGSNDETYTELT